VIKIFVDSTCDLPDEYFKTWGIEMVPLRVILNGKEYMDKLTIKISEVYETMRNGIIPKTSQPNYAEAYDIVYKQAAQGYNCIFLSFSEKLSGTYQIISSVFKEISTKFTNLKMEVIDTKSAALSSGIMAYQAARLAAAGKSFEEIVRMIKQLVNHVEYIFTISDLNWLIKGGRISKVDGFLGNVLNIKPVLQLRDGKIELIGKVRSKKKALNTLVDTLEQRMAKFPEQIIGISHADDLETATELETMIKARLGKINTITCMIGSVLGAHLGIGGVGVCCFSKLPELYVY